MLILPRAAFIYAIKIVVDFLQSIVVESLAAVVLSFEEIDADNGKDEEQEHADDYDISQTG